MQVLLWIINPCFVWKLAEAEGDQGGGRKEDIYSIGIILIVLVSGKFPSEYSKFGPNQKKSIVDWAHHSLHDYSLSYCVTWVDCRVGDADHKELRSMMKLALRGTNSDPAQRPSATDVYEFLNESLVSWNSLICSSFAPCIKISPPYELGLRSFTDE